MDYIREISKLAEWGLRGDTPRVSAYLNLLIEKAKTKGDSRFAERLIAVRDQAGFEVTSSNIAGNSRVPVDGESRLDLADKVSHRQEDWPIVLSQAIEERIAEFISAVQKQDELEALGIQLAPSLLIYGPPGCGKTQLARNISARLELPLITARADAMISSYLGSTSKNIRLLFEHASRSHCVLFLDEFDALAKIRDDRQELGELKRVVVSVLQNLDTLSTNVVLIAATNHAHLLDPAIWRRFSYRINLDVPNTDQRASMFRMFLGNFAANIDPDLLARLSNGLSGSDIKTLCNDAMRDAVLTNGMNLNSLRLYREILSQSIGWNLQDEIENEHLNNVAQLDPEYFTGKRLAEVFNLSPSTISRKLKKGTDHA